MKSAAVAALLAMTPAFSQAASPSDSPSAKAIASYGVLTPFDPSKPPPPLPMVVRPSAAQAAASSASSGAAVSTISPTPSAASAPPLEVASVPAADRSGAAQGAFSHGSGKAGAKLAAAKANAGKPDPTWVPAAAPSGAPPELTPRQASVAEIAVRNGDRDFLMSDKVDGRLIVFEKGQPVLAGPALTGASPRDQWPPGILKKSSAYKFTAQDKVTPAGRFTVRWDNDPELGGQVLEINEVHGPDWWIAIHRVYLGIPSEHRKERLYSGDPEQSHISFGCINVTPDAMQYLIKRIPHSALHTPLYVLPRDQTATATYFKPKDAVVAEGAPHT